MIDISMCEKCAGENHANIHLEFNIGPEDDNMVIACWMESVDGWLFVSGMPPPKCLHLFEQLLFTELSDD